MEWGGVEAWHEYGLMLPGAKNCFKTLVLTILMEVIQRKREFWRLIQFHFDLISGLLTNIEGNSIYFQTRYDLAKREHSKFDKVKEMNLLQTWTSYFMNIK